MITVVVVFVCAIALTSLLARTPLAVPLTGRKQVPLSTLIPAQWRARHDDARAQDNGAQDNRAQDTGLEDTGLEARVTTPSGHD